ncbi:MAG: DegT/DnrJ/EryC1/StrS family aminotransferase [Anaerolineae bacterium]|nr:DegT/DnrJ/EryC1/StrS family aminotransferase [Anaerolineae bacterium]
MIRLIIPSIEEDDLQAVREILASGYLVQGPRVAAFERAIADYVGVQHAVAVSNCTAALHLSLLALDVRPGDLVVVAAYSWIATANVIELCGAQPVFVDVQPDTFNMDPMQLAQVMGRLMENSATAVRVKAILPVHTFGQMADMPAILEVARHYRIPVVEDAACALGASWDGLPAGSWGSMGCFSFHPRKAITTGEGGMIVTNDAGLARTLRMLRNHGLDPESTTADFVRPGFNYRLTEFQGALGLTQFAKLERIITARQKAAAHYDQLLAGASLCSPVVSPGVRHIYQSYVTLLPEEAVSRRADLIRHWHEQDVEAAIGTIHMPLTAYYQSRYGYREGDFPVTDVVAERSVTLPLYENMSPTVQARVVEVVLADLMV